MAIEILRTLITSCYQCTPTGGRYQLSEPKNAKFPNTKITTGKEVLLCQFDGYAPNLTPFFNHHVKHAHSMVDFVAFVNSRGTNFVFLIELSHRKKKTRQRAPAERFVNYLEQTAVGLFGIGSPFEYRYLIINTSPAKGSTKPGKFFDETGKGEWKAGLDLNLSILCV